MINDRALVSIENWWCFFVSDDENDDENDENILNYCHCKVWHIMLASIWQNNDGYLSWLIALFVWLVLKLSLTLLILVVVTCSWLVYSFIIPTCRQACWGYIVYCLFVCFLCVCPQNFGKGYLRPGLTEGKPPKVKNWKIDNTFTIVSPVRQTCPTVADHVTNRPPLARWWPML